MLIIRKDVTLSWDLKMHVPLFVRLPNSVTPLLSSGHNFVGRYEIGGFAGELIIFTQQRNPLKMPGLCRKTTGLPPM